jgi:hypothetical protein
LNYKASSDGHASGFNTHHIASFSGFLGTFAGYRPSTAERARFSSIWDYPGKRFKSWIGPHFVQIHFPSFALAENSGKWVGSDGLQFLRQRGQIPSSDLGGVPVEFEEKRISIFGVLSTFHGTWFEGQLTSEPSICRVLILAEDNVEFTFDRNNLKEAELKWWPGWGGTIAFQTAIFLTVKAWEKEWNKCLDQIDDCLRFELRETMQTQQIAKWMFDLDFKRSRLYFTILQILRIFGESIRGVSSDLRALDSLFLPSSMRPVFWDPSPDEVHDFGSNWKYITQHQKDAEERLMKRLLEKTAEVESLRDGV